MAEAGQGAPGSRRSGILVGVFLAAVAAACAFVASFGARRLVHDLVVLARWPAAECRVESCRFDDAQGEAEGELPQVRATLADGRAVRGWDGWRAPDGTFVWGSQCAAFERGARVPCWLDPRSPDRMAVVRWKRPQSTVSLVAGLLALGLLALAIRVSFVRDTAPSAVLGPGETLAWRLRPDLSRRSQAIALAVLALVANSVAWLPLVMAVRLGAWKPLVALPFTGGFGLWTLWLFARTLLAGRGLADARVEAAAQAARPGGTVALQVTQSGPAELAAVVVRLVCEETVRRTQGHGRSRTSRDDTTTLFDAELARAGPVALDSGAPLTLACEAGIPADAEPTREGAREVRWHVVVDVSRPGRAVSSQRFELRVERQA